MREVFELREISGSRACPLPNRTSGAVACAAVCLEQNAKSGEQSNEAGSAVTKLAQSNEAGSAVTKLTQKQRNRLSSRGTHERATYAPLPHVAVSPRNRFRGLPKGCVRCHGRIAHRRSHACALSAHTPQRSVGHALGTAEAHEHAVSKRLL